ncbi:MAG: hypothetical protein IPG68_16310 [Micrococcales bacterium]|nr:hypothetical protein [Micrococcales bacterium]
MSVPLEVTDSGDRSGWHTVNHDHLHLIDRYAFGYGNWVHCVWPTAFLRDHLGPHALLPDQALSGLEVPRNQVHKQEGQWWARVPRFFRTVGVRWSTVYGSSRWQGHSGADAADGATVATSNWNTTSRPTTPTSSSDRPALVFYQDPDAEGHHVVQRRLEATLPSWNCHPARR